VGVVIAMSVAQPETHPEARLHAVDALRAGAMLLGVYLHAALAYMYTPHGVSPVIDNSKSFFFDMTVAGIHGFRMQLFYVVAGFFAAMLIRRRGLRGFLVNRVKRVLLPMVVAALVVCPLVAWTFVAGQLMTGTNSAELGPWAALADAARSGRWIIGFAIPMHLWFLWYLLAFCVLLAGAVRLARWRGIHAAWLADRVASSVRSVRGLLVLIGFATLATVPMSGWMIETPGSWVLSPATLIYYGLFFACGALLFVSHHGGLAGNLAGVGRRWGLLLALALVSFCMLGIVGGRLTPRWMAAIGGGGLATEVVNLPAAALQATFTWSAILCCFGLSLRYLAHPGPRLGAVVRYLSDGSYWIYLVHLPIAYLLQVLLYPVGAGAAVKVLVVVGVTSALSVGSYQLLVRHTWIGRLLNGARKR
jgi:surface polysaccharide O-acyltransferase-like enzyme